MECCGCFQTRTSNTTGAGDARNKRKSKTIKKQTIIKDQILDAKAGAVPLPSRVLDKKRPVTTTLMTTNNQLQP